MTHQEAVHASFHRAGLWHLVGEGRRLEHFLRTGRWQPTLERVPFLDGIARPDVGPGTTDWEAITGIDWESYG